MRILLRNAQLIDGTGSAAQDGAALLIEGDTIVHGGPLPAGDAPDPAATLVVDAGGRTVVPGLVEAHLRHP
jgi:imidazolonepropionase-like amidohydrolase